MSDLIFTDTEVFKHDSMIVLMNRDKEVIDKFHNDFEGLSDIIEGKTLVHYNGYFYDDHIIHAMINQNTPEQIKTLNDRIISGEKLRINNYKYHSLDCFQQIDVAKPGLKKIEGNMGKMILESSVDFTTDRKLTPDEVEEVFDYCIYDTEMVVEVYNMREKSYFEPKKYLTTMLKTDNKNAYRWNTTTLSANVLIDKPLTKWGTIRLGRTADETENMLGRVPEDVQNLWDLPPHEVIGKPKGSVTVKRFDCDIQFGFGGLHGVHQRIKKAKNVKLLDVASLYPNIILNLDILGTATQTYKEILQERLKVKHTDKTKSDALKLILNSVYGNLKNDYSILKNNAGSLSVCIYGQIALYDLCERLSDSCTLININTDGVAFTTDSEDYKDVWTEWEQDYNLTLEEDRFDTFIQRDVNNYIATIDGDIKVKGGDVNRYHYDALFKNNNARIIDIALVDYLVYGTPVLDTIAENRNKPHLYQYILQAGGTYKGTFDKAGNKYNKINRVFAGKKPRNEDPFCLFKKRQDDGLVKFPDTPDNMILWNDETDKFTDFADKVDINHYYQIAKKKVERWENV